jgi:ectoine hydroxylase-related dioxygenase (phytanoyl-CoA dioxygenase family)
VIVLKSDAAAPADMMKGTEELTTCWVPLMDIPLEMGPLCVLEGSNSLPGFAKMRSTFGAWDFQYGDEHSSTPGVNDVRGPGPITSNPWELLSYDADARWVSANFEQGDVLCFAMHTLHGSLVNQTDTNRLSIDVRYQPTEATLDPRYSIDGKGSNGPETDLFSLLSLRSILALKQFLGIL